MKQQLVSEVGPLRYFNSLEEIKKVHISDDDKQRIMKELAQGNINPLPGTTDSSSEVEGFDPHLYQNFDDFAQRPTHRRQPDDSAQAFFNELENRGLNDPGLKS